MARIEVGRKKNTLKTKKANDIIFECNFILSKFSFLSGSSFKAPCKLLNVTIIVNGMCQCQPITTEVW